MSELPRILAHRGDAAHYPENTLPALAAAIRAGADAVGLDVQFCRDGTPVVLHDPTLDRVSGRPGSLLDLEFAELEDISAHEPERFGDRFRGTGIPSLTQAVEMLRGHPGTLVFVEIKRDTVPHHAIPQAVATVLDACKPLGERLVIMSFDAGIAQEARSLGQAKVGWVLPDWTTAALDQLETVQPDFAFADPDVVPPPPTPLWEGPWQWGIGEINDPTTIEELVKRGVEWIVTSDVERVVDALSKRQQAL